MSNPYVYADKMIRKIRKRINTEFTNEVNLVPFDRINAITVRKNAKALYKRLERADELAYRLIAKDAYDKATEESGGMSDVKREGFDDVVEALLLSYNSLTGYQFRAEVKRKRDRMIEAILAAKDRRNERIAYEKAARLWVLQSEQYSDLTVDAARMQAFEDAGVENVEWVTQEDAKVCKTCRERNGKVYPIREAPDKAHYHCRCFYIPAE